MFIKISINKFYGYRARLTVDGQRRGKKSAPNSPLLTPKSRKTRSANKQCKQSFHCHRTRLAQFLTMGATRGAAGKRQKGSLPACNNSNKYSRRTEMAFMTRASAATCDGLQGLYRVTTGPSSPTLAYASRRKRPPSSP